MSISNLPLELYNQILSYLDLRNLEALSKTCVDLEEKTIGLAKGIASAKITPFFQSIKDFFHQKYSEQKAVYYSYLLDTSSNKISEASDIFHLKKTLYEIKTDLIEVLKQVPSSLFELIATLTIPTIFFENVFSQIFEKSKLYSRFSEALQPENFTNRDRLLAQVSLDFLKFNAVKEASSIAQNIQDPFLQTSAQKTINSRHRFSEERSFENRIKTPDNPIVKAFIKNAPEKPTGTEPFPCTII